VIHVVEGPNAAGKSTLCCHLSRVLRIPLYCDLSRRIEGRTGAELQLATPAFDLIVEQVARNHDFVLDRFWPTTYVFKELNPDRPDLPDHLARGPVVRARAGAATEVLYYVSTPVDLILARLRERGEAVDEAGIVSEVAAYERVFAAIRDEGVPVVVVDGSRGLEGLTP
jgi:thymidylate kinase